MVKMVTVILYIFYHDKKIIKEIRDREHKTPGQRHCDDGGRGPGAAPRSLERQGWPGSYQKLGEAWGTLKSPRKSQSC